MNFLFKYGKLVLVRIVSVMKLEAFHEQDNKKKFIIIFTILCVFLVCGVFLYKAFALYQVVTNKNIIEGTVQDPGDLYFAFYKDNVISSTMPTKTDGYVFDSAKSSCTNSATITWDATNWAPTITNLTTSRTKCTLYFVKPGAQKIIDLKTAGDTTLEYDGTTDNNLRYIGATPNNYVSFNGELWRIIGVMNNIDNGSGTKETRLKIIRNESIGDYSWDSSDSTINSGWGVNEWSGADLMTELNSGPYWNRTNGTCYNGQSNSTATCDFSSIGLTSAAQAMIGTALWNTGSQGTNDYTKTATGLASNFYTYERSSDNGKICTSGDGCNDTVNRTTTWIGKIGLMYPSDYGYATAGGSITNRASCLAEPLDYWDAISDCRTNNWLYNASLMQWTLMPCVSSSVSSDVFRVYGEGHVYDSTAFTGDAVRPVGYLDSKTKIASGSGTSTDPYILSL